MRTLQSNQNAIAHSFASAAKSFARIAKTFENIAKGHKRLQVFMTSSMLFLCLAVSAQRFDKINALGKDATEVCQITKELMYVTSGTDKGDFFTSYYCIDFGVIEYVFNDNDICKKIVVHSQPGRGLIVNSELFNLITVREKDKVTYIVTLKRALCQK